MIITSLSSHCFSTKGSEHSLGVSVLAPSLMLLFATKAFLVVGAIHSSVLLFFFMLVPLGPLLSDCESLQACAQLFQCLSGACTLGHAVWVSVPPSWCPGLLTAEP
uniref:Uncharacterized protein n=1 Tax=Aotus nancymaae TaxID=37293 RepID=A0A2K5DMI3_AOTNA